MVLVQDPNLGVANQPCHYSKSFVIPPRDPITFITYMVQPETNVYVLYFY